MRTTVAAFHMSYLCFAAIFSSAVQLTGQQGLALIDQVPLHLIAAQGSQQIALLCGG
jgi:hypothetical protein